MYYVVQVETGKEQKAIEDIHKYNTNMDADLDVFSPYRLTKRKVKGQWIDHMEQCFPGYVFVETNDAKRLFFDLYWIPGFQRLLGREGLTYNFVPLNEEEARMVDILYNRNTGRVTPISDIEVEEGQIVRILDGPLMYVKGVIKHVNLHKRTVTIVIEMFNRTMEIKVGINIVTKVDS